MTIPELLHSIKTIAVVGLSDDPEKPSYGVAKRLQQKGFTIIPVNPKLKEWEGLKSYVHVSDIPDEIEVEVVDIFRKGEVTPEVVLDALKRKHKPKAIWLQSGITSEESKRLTEEAGMFYVEDHCMGVEARILPNVT
jgi:predicted CoA-binding protein